MFNFNKSDRIENLMREAMTLFGDGYREDTISMFEVVLNNPASTTRNRIVASCILGEIYRGMGNFGKAQQYYEWSIRESATIPASMQGLDEYVRHYRPRAFCGLLTVYRRTLFDDHSKIQALLSEIKVAFSTFPIEDLPAQVLLMEGLYLRQLGDLSGSVGCIEEGLDLIRKAGEITPYFLFLHPEHFEALLFLSHLCLPGNTYHARRISQEVLKANRGPWSLAFAAAAQLHLYLRQVANGAFTSLSSNEFGQDVEKVAALIQILQKNARFENDPLLLSECAMLSLIWYLLVEDFVNAEREINNLHDIIPSCSQPLILHRAVEIGALQMEFTLAGLANHASLEKIFNHGCDVFHVLVKPLQSYGCSVELCEHWKKLLYREAPKTDYVLDAWISEELMQLRSRVWP